MVAAEALLRGDPTEEQMAQLQNYEGHDRLDELLARAVLHNENLLGQNDN